MSLNTYMYVIVPLSRPAKFTPHLKQMTYCFVEEFHEGMYNKGTTIDQATDSRRCWPWRRASRPLAVPHLAHWLASRRVITTRLRCRPFVVPGLNSEPIVRGQASQTILPAAVVGGPKTGAQIGPAHTATSATTAQISQSAPRDCR